MKERKWLRWTALFLLALLIALPAVGTKAVQASTVASGSCGDDLTWKLSSSGKLTISGSGKMDAYTMTKGLYGSYSTEYPWYEYCDQITAVTIKSGVTSIAKGAFADCWAVETVSIPDSVTSIGTGAFADCTSLTSISVSEDNAKFSASDGVLYNKKQTKLVAFPGGLTGDFTIPSGVTTISAMSFYGNSLDEITIPSGVTTIGKDAFGHHNSIYGASYNYLTLVFEGSAPSVNGRMFEDISGINYYIMYPVSEADSWAELIDTDAVPDAQWESYNLSLKSSGAEITLSKTSYTYTGKKKTPSVTVTVNGETLTKGTDYTVSYSSGRTSIGKYTVKIKGKGDYTGTVTKTFKIKPAKVSLKSSTKSSSSKTLTVKWSKVSGSVKYQIAYKVKGGSWKYKTVSSTTYSKTLTGLKSGKYYYVKVRAYKSVDGTKYYGSWSTTKKVKVK